MKANGEDLSFVQVEIVDKDGRICPNAAIELEANVTGQGQLAAMGNADIKDIGSYVDAKHNTWKGRALVIVRSTQKAGKSKLTIKAAGLKPAVETIVSK